MDNNGNSLVEIRTWFGKSKDGYGVAANRQVEAREFTDFWKSCNDQDKAAMKTLELAKL